MPLDSSDPVLAREAAAAQGALEAAGLNAREVTAFFPVMELCSD